MYFFNFNQEKKIGFKKLTSNDLGQKCSGNQTHIGLYKGVFTFLQDSDVVKSAMLIYDNYCDILDCSFDRIQNQDGTFRSPKIKVGTSSNDSVVSKIRAFANNDPNADWYLLWTGLESEELIFLLVKDKSDDFKAIKNILPKVNMVYSFKDDCYSSILEVLKRKVNGVSVGVQKEIETVSQIGDRKNRFKRIDVERAEKIFRSIGEKGEKLVAEYLAKQKSAKLISSFEWLNQSKESGFPFDFTIDNKKFVDVKATTFNFEQYVYLSNQEVEFANSHNDYYEVFRIYDMKEDSSKMKICSNCIPYLSDIDKNILQFVGNLKGKNAMVQTLKLGILPSNCFVDIQPSIQLK